MTFRRSVPIWIALVAPSLAIVFQYLSWPGVAAYAVTVWLILEHADAWTDRIPRAWIGRLSVMTAASVFVAFVALHPRVDVSSGYAGSDDDEALDLGVAALLAGQSPYSQLTYLDNVLHQLPGAFVMAAPFAAVGGSALQNLFWLPAFFVVFARVSGDSRLALAVAWLVLVASPGVMAHVITGTGHLSNTIYVLLALDWLTRTEHRGVAAAVWGVTLASRANFLFLVPLAFGRLWRDRGLRAATVATTIALAVVALLTVPFYLANPREFGPLEAADRLFIFPGASPVIGLFILGAMYGAALLLAVPRMSRSELFGRCALVQAIPIVAGTVLDSIQIGAISVDFLPYSMFASWFVWMAGAERAREERPV